MNDLQEDGVLSEWNQIGALQVAAELREFIEKEALPGTGIEPDRLWSALDAILHDLAPRNRELLKKRDDLQAKIDAWHGDHRSRPIDLEDTRLPARDRLPGARGRGLRRSPPPTSTRRSPTVAGPQLVVPVINARYALNAANARWGSLYDALYGTDAIPETTARPAAGGYNPTRGAKVIAFARRLLDEAAPLADGSHADAAGYAVDDGKLVGDAEERRRPRGLRDAGRSSPATRATPRRRRPCCCATTACTSRSRSTAATPSARTTPPASPTWCSRRRSPRSWTGGLGRRRRCRGQGRGLPQLAGPDEGHARPPPSRRAASTIDAPAEPRPHYTAPDGGEADPARPQPDAGAQRRPPDDHRRRRSTATASEVSGRHPRRAGHHR